MKNPFRAAALSVALAAGAAGLVSLADPQAALGQAKGKAEPKADPKGKADPVKPAEAKGKVVISKDKQEKFRFFVKDENDKTLAMSTVGYETEADARAMIETVKALLASKKAELEK